MAVASLEETQGLLSRFDRVYSGYRYITQGCPGGALAVAMSLRARCLFFPTHGWLVDRSSYVAGTTVFTLVS